MKRAEALNIAEATLNGAGYEVSRRCVARASCFDFAARKEEKLIFIKVFPDIRDVSPGDALGIRAISRCFSCTPLFITDKNDEDALRDDTVYSRYGVHVVTSKTFEDVVRGAFPLVEAARGGYYVRTDGGKIRERRRKLGLSIGKLAAMVGISRRTLYGYERDMTRASVSAAYQLEEILGVPLVTAIDIFEAPPHSSDPGAHSENDPEKTISGFLEFIISKLTQFDFKVSLTSRAPFDFTADCLRRESKIIGGVFKTKERDAESRMKEIVSLSRIVAARPLLVGKEKTGTPEGVAFLDYDELTKMLRREELAAWL